MKYAITFCLTVALALALVGCPKPSTAPKYSVQEITLDAVGLLTATVLNNAGQVAGQSGNQAAVWKNGTVTLLPGYGTPGETSIATGITDTGVPYGWITPGIAAADKVYGLSNAVIWSFGEAQDIYPDLPSATAILCGNDRLALATAIYDEPYLIERGRTDSLGLPDNGGTPSGDVAYVNDRNEVVGWVSVDTAGTTQAALWTPQGLTQIGTLNPGETSAATAINLRGDVCGNTMPMAGKTAVTVSTAWVYDRSGNTTVLPGLTTTEGTFAEAINNRGDVVGYAMQNGVQYAVVWRPQLFGGYKIAKLDDNVGATAVGSSLVNAIAINDKGQIVAYTNTPTKISAAGSSWLVSPNCACLNY